MAEITALVILFLISTVNGFLVDDDDSYTTVNTPVGEIFGRIVNVQFNGQSGHVRKFLGIPYAEAPVGDRRFRKPVAKSSFTSPYNATYGRPFCFQLSNENLDNVTSEDCLVLNVYVPDGGSLVKGTPRLPVMVWIHGGGFVYGNSGSYVADTLSYFGQVIVVTINYRVAVMGFLSTGEPIAPGNYGLWDQHLAIRWVHDNIEAFGGNKHMVTIFGESAGSSSVIYQAMFPGNKGLIQRAIAESGTIASFWGVSGDPYYKEYTRAFAVAAGCPQVNFTDIMTCLRKKTSDELRHVPTRLNGTNFWFPWKPVVDGEFLKEDARKALSSGKASAASIAALQDVDLLIGYNNFDGALMLNLWPYQYNATDVDNFFPSDKQFRKIISDSLLALLQMNAPSVVEAAVYFEYNVWNSNNDDGKQRLRNLVDMVTDSSLLAPTIQTLGKHYNDGAMKKKSFLYEFAVRPDIGHVGEVSRWMDGPTFTDHGDDLLYVFGFDQGILSSQSFLSNASTVDVRMSETVMTMWTNFAKTGDPNTPTDILKYTGVAWPQYEPTSMEYLEISANMGPSSAKAKPNPRALGFWTTLLPTLLDSAVNDISK